MYEHPYLSMLGWWVFLGGFIDQPFQGQVVQHWHYDLCCFINVKPIYVLPAFFDQSPLNRVDYKEDRNC